MKKNFIGKLFLHIALITISLCFVLPVILVVIISLSTEQSIIDVGYSFFPKELSLDAYKLAFANPKQIVDSYVTTTVFSVSATVLALLVEMLAAYPLSKRNFKYKKVVLIFALITMLFNGGLIPNYIIRTRFLHLHNTIWVYIIPTLASAWNMLIMRTFFQGLPEGLSEAAKIDGAGEYRILFQILLPLSTPVLATLGFRMLIARWNDWNTSLIYIRNPELYSLQYLLQKILREAEFIKKMANEGLAGTTGIDAELLPVETLRFAMAVIAAGPMMVVFPFFQKYLAKGLVVGSVKG